jgi:hypothetical protein
MSERSVGKVTGILSFIGGVSGFIAIATLVFYGGAMAEQVRVLNARVTTLEAMGSPPLREHVKQDSAEYQSLSERVTRLENIMITIPAELSRISTKLDLVKEKVDKLDKQ